MNRLRRTVTMFLAVASTVTFALVGCAPTPEPTPSPTSTGSAESSPSSTPTPATPVVTLPDPSDPGTWVIDGAGVGPIAIGGSADLAATLPDFTVTAGPEGCPVTFLNGLGLILATVNDETGSVVGIHVRGPEATISPRTAEGIGLGSAETDVTAAYPTVSPVDFLPGSRTYAVPSAGRFIVLVVDATGVTQLTVHDFDRVPKELCG